MKTNNETISLLPFLESSADAFLLEISTLEPARESWDRELYPFQLADHERNFSLIVKGGLKVSNSRHTKPLFLLAQRDHYPIAPDDLSPVTNTTIDNAWYQTLVRYLADETSFIVPRQLSDESSPAIPFAPLFFCRNVNRFFHPPCPECGGELRLCKDDDILIKEALFPYTTSLRRYLFCPGCYPTKGSQSIYQYARSGQDPVYIKDRFDLIREFHKVRNTEGSSFPCPDCIHHSECYHVGEKAANRIGFFSFYPFHMVMLDAGLMKASQFIPLLSGALFDEIKNRLPASTAQMMEKMLDHSQERHFFFKEDERFYLEVLMLKLSFFEQILVSVCKQLDNHAQLTQLSTQSIWVQPTDHGSILPFFWDFRLQMIDLVADGSTNGFNIDKQKTGGLQFVAALFFYLFFVNKRQDQKIVYDELERLVAQSPMSLDGYYDQCVREYPFSAMQNIFWDPDLQKVPEKWQDFWVRIMETGLGLFRVEKDQDMYSSLDQLIQKVSQFKNSVKLELFSADRTPVPVASPAPKQQPEPEVLPECDEPVSPGIDNPAIVRILKKVKAQWQSQDETGPDIEEDDVLETIVLTSEETDTPETAGGDFDTAVEETVIISPQTPAAAPIPGAATEPAQKAEPEPVPEPSTAPSPEQGGGFDDMEATVVISPTGAPEKKDEGFFGEDDDLDKTVVISPKK